MSFNQNMATITVGDVTYDVETHSTDMGQKYTIQLDGEDVFEGLEGLCENEQYIEDFHNPRGESNVGTMAVHYRGYNLGGDDDEDISQIDFEVECKDCEGSGETYGPDNMVSGFTVRPPDCPKCEGSGYVTLNPPDYFRQERGARVVIGLTVYEHSGITMRAGDVTLPWDTDRWDTSFIGFIYDTPKQVKECMGENVTDKQIEEALRSEVAIYASYLEGDVTWYCVEDDETNFMESCGGYIGDHDECEKEMYSALEQALVKRIDEEAERAYWLAREVVTI